MESRNGALKCSGRIAPHPQSIKNSTSDQQNRSCLVEWLQPRQLEPVPELVVCLRLRRFVQ